MKNEIFILKLSLQLFVLIFKNANGSVVKNPNLIIIIADDLGIGDLGCYGNSTIKTPNIDNLAKEGVLLDHHLTAAELCTPSRAALLTGRYPARYGLVGEQDTPPVIVHVANKAHLPYSETTLAQVLKNCGYITGAVGKWHLGSGCQFLGQKCVGALNYGFSHFFGILFTLIDKLKGSASFWIFDLKSTFYQMWLVAFIISMLNVIYLLKKGFCKSSIFFFIIILMGHGIVWFIYTHYRLHTQKWWQVSSWMSQNFDGVIVRNGKVIYQRPQFNTLMDELVSESVEFISNYSKGPEPFFLYHSFGHVHIPMYTAKRNYNRSLCGSYCDNVEEMDEGVGIILKALKDNKIENDTIVYFVSDHGAIIESIDPVSGERIGGYNKLFKGGKGMGSAEGAIRVPGIFRWPNVFPGGTVIHTPTSLLDILPTTLDLVGLPSLQHIIPNAKELDGISFADILKRPNDKVRNRRRIFIHHCKRSIQGLRLVTGDKIYKLHLFLHNWKEGATHCGLVMGDGHSCDCFGDHIIDISNNPQLYELNSDPYEDFPIENTTEVYKHVVAELREFLAKWNKNVIYPPSSFKSVYDSVLLPWIQPFVYFS